MKDRRDLEIERKRLLGLMSRFVAAGSNGCTKQPHSFFGQLTPNKWAILMYKHLDHHLRQFGVQTKAEVELPKYFALVSPKSTCENLPSVG